MSLEKEYSQLKAKVVERKKDFDEFVVFLETKTTWLSSPASTKYHLSEEKGLLKHSVGVTKTLLQLREFMALLGRLPQVVRACHHNPCQLHLRQGGNF